MPPPNNPITLADWRRRVAEIYSVVRQSTPDDEPFAWNTFRATRDDLFKSHSQSPLSKEQRRRFSLLEYYPYNPGWRLAGTLDTDVARESFSDELPDEGLLRYTRVARVRFVVDGEPAGLSLFWIEGYGGGLFLPFRDATSGEETYGGGRYLYDTIKGADLGVEEKELLLDFNYAYNPSCAYGERWVCPLAPRENWLAFAIEAGEKKFQ